MKKLGLVLFALGCLCAPVEADTYTQVPFGMDRAVTPSPVCVMVGPTCDAEIGTWNLSTHTWTAAGGGGGGVSSITNGDGTLTISPTTGSAVASLALGHANTWTGLQTFSLNPVIPALPNLSSSVEGTGLSGLDGATWFIYQAPATATDALNPGLRVQRSASYTNNIALTAASGNGTTATFTYSGPAITVGDTIFISGVQPFGYNGYCVVSASATNSVSCPNTTTGAQTVAGYFIDASTIGTVQDIWALGFSSPNGAEFEWTITGQLYNQTGTALGSNAENVAVNGTVIKQYQAGGNYQTASFTGSISGTTLTVTAIVSGSLSTGNIISGGTTAANTHIVNQLTGSPAGGLGTYTVSQSQSVTSGVKIATDQISGSWGGNFVCIDSTNVQDPVSPCLGTEIDNYWITGAGTDTNAQRVVLQLAWGGLTGGATGSTDHIGVGILWGAQDQSVMDNALLFGGGGSYGIILNTAAASVTSYLIYGNGITIDGSGNTVAASLKATPVAIASLPSCASTNLGTIKEVSNGTAYGTGTYGSAVSATGAVTRKVFCTNTGGPSTYAWAYN